MIQRETNPIEAMARHLAGYPDHVRATPEAAALLLHRDGHRSREIALGLDAAMALVGARATDLFRDAALAVLAAGGAMACGALA